MLFDSVVFQEKKYIYSRWQGSDFSDSNVSHAEFSFGKNNASYHPIFILHFPKFGEICATYRKNREQKEANFAKQKDHT